MKSNGIHIHIAENGLIVEDCETGKLYNTGAFAGNWPEMALQYKVYPGAVFEAVEIIKRILGCGEEEFFSKIPVAEDEDNCLRLVAGETLKKVIDECKKKLIVQTLILTGNNKTEAAKLLVVQRTYLSRLVTRYNLNGSLNRGASYGRDTMGRNTGQA